MNAADGLRQIAAELRACRLDLADDNERYLQSLRARVVMAKATCDRLALIRDATKPGSSRLCANNDYCLALANRIKAERELRDAQS